MTGTADFPLSDPVEGTSKPDTYWATTNVAEATPDLLSPLCWDVWSDGLERAWLRSMHDFGLLSRKETVIRSDPNQRSTAAIYGRQAANVAVIRRVLARLPGVSPDDVERDLLGSVRQGLPKEPGAGLRLPIIVAKLPWVMLRTTALVAKMHARNRLWWQNNVFHMSKQSDPMALLEDSAEMFAESMNMHSRVRFLLPAAERAVLATSQRARGHESSASLIGGFGDIAETALADELWLVSQGTSSVQKFLSEYGFHGPNEGNVYTRSWREDPQRVLALVDSYRGRDDLVRPRDREQAAMCAQQESNQRVVEQLPWALRPLLRFAVKRLGNVTRNLEMTKAAYLRSLDGARAAARAVGAELCARGVLDDAEDAFFLTRGELSEVWRGANPGVRELIAYRRAQRARYASVELPIAFTGMPALRTLVSETADEKPRATSLTGNAGGCGTVEGRARVVTSPYDDVELEAGDILVCHTTDPSWVVLFVCAAGLVIDIGSATSHGAVVARELGLPYVIGCAEATSEITDGDHIRVDGPQRQVLILERSRPNQ